eukprot:CAMPEP_0113629752 /NCGR_PEP_ID=MMETSP0017_2-20120614/15451_1 /TAXON_ID=2856 /ORGANISM="Cylindrotheca closterium" /LENGTH=245 /DNA_ID=CAMNT_0000540175 /DNA_START=283 /DNA_END=1016 /DNA_ORIENTATION=+ /assembly_acc=CAM_ASM_000147
MPIINDAVSNETSTFPTLNIATVAVCGTAAALVLTTITAAVGVPTVVNRAVESVGDVAIMQWLQLILQVSAHAIVLLFATVTMIGSIVKNLFKFVFKATLGTIKLMKLIKRVFHIVFGLLFALAFFAVMVTMPVTRVLSRKLKLFFSSLTVLPVVSEVLDVYLKFVVVPDQRPSPPPGWVDGLRAVTQWLHFILRVSLHVIVLLLETVTMIGTLMTTLFKFTFKATDGTIKLVKLLKRAFMTVFP